MLRDKVNEFYAKPDCFYLEFAPQLENQQV